MGQTIRKLRKLCGLQTTKDIGTLSSFLLRLWALALADANVKKTFLNGGVLISSPLLPSLPHDDFDEALEYIGLHRLHSYKLSYLSQHLSQPAATYAGMGYGLCKHWHDIRQCEAEEANMGWNEILALSYTNEELNLEHLSAREAYHQMPLALDRVPHLGLKTQIDSPYMFEAISKRIIAFASDKPLFDMLLVMGEEAEEKRFLDAVWHALDQLELQDLYTHLQRPEFNATYVTARGTAEIAKRWQGETWGCVEPDSCEKIRRRVELISSR